tara:strand:+ start:633 stop:764 length:132 start_codon:yes stop_codon:yes gene_type:complete
MARRPITFHEWRDMMERRYDVMPPRYWKNPQKMYEEYKEMEAC